jgi:hypothetical protein
MIVFFQLFVEARYASRLELPVHLCLVLTRCTTTNPDFPEFPALERAHKPIARNGIL